MRTIVTKLRASLRDTWHGLLTVGVVWLGQASTCLAQTPGQEETKAKTYVPVYLIIIFTVGLGLLLICRTAKRDDKIRRR